MAKFSTSLILKKIDKNNFKKYKNKKKNKKKKKKKLILRKKRKKKTCKTIKKNMLMLSHAS
jgi:hypothetical protein